MNNITNNKIKLLIEDYINQGYRDAVNNRCWDNMYIHAPRTKKFNQDGVPYCAIWKRLIKEQLKELKNYADFENILAVLKDIKKFNEVIGIGDLILYDTATCIACPEKKYPVDVHLHAGALKGACAIKMANGKNNVVISRCLFIRKYPAFSVLTSLEIEDFLCIYRHDLEGDTTKGKQARAFVKNNKRKCICCN